MELCQRASALDCAVSALDFTASGKYGECSILGVHRPRAGRKCGLFPRVTRGVVCVFCLLGTCSCNSSFICSNKKTHTWSTREQQQDKKGTENWRLHFAHKKRKKNKHTRYKNNYNYNYYNYDYAYRKNAEKSTRLSDRLHLDNDEKSTAWGKKFQTFIMLSIIAPCLGTRLKCAEWESDLTNLVVAIYGWQLLRNRLTASIAENKVSNFSNLYAKREVALNFGLRYISTHFHHYLFA